MPAMCKAQYGKQKYVLGKINHLFKIFYVSFGKYIYLSDPQYNQNIEITDCFQKLPMPLGIPPLPFSHPCSPTCSSRQFSMDCLSCRCFGTLKSRVFPLSFLSPSCSFFFWFFSFLVYLIIVILRFS